MQGTAAIQLCKSYFKVQNVIITASNDKLEFCKSIGADVSALKKKIEFLEKTYDLCCLFVVVVFFFAIRVLLFFMCYYTPPHRLH